MFNLEPANNDESISRKVVSVWTICETYIYVNDIK